MKSNIKYITTTAPLIRREHVGEENTTPLPRIFPSSANFLPCHKGKGLESRIPLPYLTAFHSSFTYTKEKGKQMALSFLDQEENYILCYLHMVHPPVVINLTLLHSKVPPSSSYFPLSLETNSSYRD